MAAGDAYIKMEANIPINGYFNLQPPVGTEIIIHNFMMVTATTNLFDVEHFDGINSVVIYSGSASSGTNQTLHCTNTSYLRIKNTSSDIATAFADGIYTK